MKKVWFMLAMMVCILASCSDGGSENPIEPTPKPEEVKTEIIIDSSIISNGLSFSAAEGEQSISFSVNANWTLSIASTTSGTTWCKASATSGSKGTANVKFTIGENTDYEDRSVSVTIKAGTVSKTFTITQKGIDALLVTTTKYEVAQEGGQIEIEVKANIDYKMEISEEAKDWIKESSGRALTTYKHKLDIAMNEDAENREGEITFKSGDKVEIVKVYQAGGAILLLSQNEYNVSDKGDTISVDIKSNIDFGIQMPDVDWIIDEASSRGMSSHTLKYIVSANEAYDSRSADIVFYDKNSDLKDTLKVVQAQKDAIILSQKEFEVNPKGETIEIEVSCNVDFEIFIENDWVTQFEAKFSRGLISHKLYFQIAENGTEKERSTKINITNKNKQIVEVVVIKQSIKEIIPNNQIWYTSSDGNIVNPTFVENPYFYSNPFGVTITSNTYINGKGIITFDGDLTTIGESAFYQCNTLTSIVIPNSVTTIGSAFSSCESLTSVTIPNSVTIIEDHAFAHCYSLIDIKIPNKITDIKEYTFYDCKSLKEITIPNTVTSIGNYAFYGCQELINITIPSNVTSIGNSAFNYCRSLTSIVVESGNSVYDSRENCNGIIEKGANKLILGCKNTIIPNSVTTIGFRAFCGCSSMTEITIPNSVTTIGDWAFFCCFNLSNVIIPNSVTSIGDYAFSNCYNSLTEIIIPNSVNSIGKFAFTYCKLLKEISIPKSVTKIGTSPFMGCSSLTSIVVEDGNSTYDSRDNCNAIIETETNTLIQGGEKTIIPNSVTTIGDAAFSVCTSLTEITIPNTVTRISKNAFDYCTSLKEITIPSKVTSIGNEAFWDCTSLLKVNVMATTPPTIESGTFKGCKSDLKIYVPATSLEAYQKTNYWKDMNLLSDNQ